MRPSDLLWSSLHILTKERFDALREVYGDLESAAKHIGEELLIALGCKRETVMRVLLRLEEFDEDAYARQLQDLGIGFLSLEDDAYPSPLRQIGDPPPFLYFKGALELAEKPGIGVVGTRRMTPYGRRVVEHFVGALVQAQIVTVSGLAIGIDEAVARGTMKAGGKTVAVLGNGLPMIYPRSNTHLAEEIVENGGLLLSEFPLDYEPDKYTFPARNRIIAGMTLGTLVCEAGAESGAIITAELALEYGRDVFAVPGQIFDPNYDGCHALISKGHAKLVTKPGDMLRDIGILAPEEGGLVSYIPQNEEEERVYASLTTMPQAIDDLVEKTNLPSGRVSAALTMMELAGAVKNAGGGMWVRA